MDSFSLADDLSERWYASTQLCDLIEMAGEDLSRRRLLLFRASCCRPLLYFMADEDSLCKQAIDALERLAENWNYQEHNEHVLRMLNAVPNRLRSEIAEAHERRESWIRQDLQEIPLIEHQIDHQQRLHQEAGLFEPNEEYRQLLDHREQLLTGHHVINSTNLSIKSDNHRINIVNCIYQASISIAAWELHDEIASTIQRDPDIARVRAQATHPVPIFDSSVQKYYQQHCQVFREIFPGPEFDAECVEPWRQPDVLELAQEIDETRDFLQMPYLRYVLRDAGCKNETVFIHCERTDPTIRGSWLVDLLLGK